MQRLGVFFMAPSTSLEVQLGLWVNVADTKKPITPKPRADTNFIHTLVPHAHSKKTSTAQ